MGFGADQKITIKVKEEGITTTTTKINGLVTSIRQMQQIGDKTKTTVTNFGQQIEKGGKQASQMGDQMKGLALRFVGLQAAVGYAQKAFHMLSDFIGTGIERFREFQVRIAEVSTIMGENYNQIYRLASGVEHLSVMYGQTTSDVSKGLYDVMSAAFSAEDSMRLLNTAVKASIGGLSTVRESVDIFTTVLNSYGMSASQAAGVSDILFQSVVRGKFQFKDLEASLGYVVPIAAQAGIAFKELMAALSTATRHGLHLDMASRGLALAIQNIINPTEQAKTAADKYDISMDALTLRVEGLYGYFKDVNEATKEFGDTIISELIPNMRSMRVAMVLAGDEGLGGFEDDLKKLEDAAGQAEQALSKMMNTAQYQAKVLEQQLEVAQRAIGEAWSGIDIWFKKTQVWWGTWLSGGDPGAAVNRVEKQFARVEEAYWTSIQRMGKSFSTSELMEGTKEYLSAFQQAQQISEDIATKRGGAQDVKAGLKGVKQWRDALEIGNVGEWASGITTPGMEGIQKIFTSRMTDEFKAGFDKIKDYQNDITKLKDNFEEYNFTMQQTQVFFDTLTSKIDESEQELDRLSETLQMIEQDLNRLNDELTKPMLYGYGDAAAYADVKISQLTTLTDEQRDSLSALGDTIRGTLGYEWTLINAEKQHADLTHDLQMGLLEENYAYRAMGEALQNDVAIMRNYNNIQKELKEEQIKLSEATDEYTRAIRLNSFEIMKIEYKGMMRRRGLTRGEERKIKQLQIDTMKNRIDAMSQEISAEERFIDYTDKLNEIEYLNAKDRVDARIRLENEKIYNLKYTYDQGLIDIEDNILDEGILLKTREEQWTTTMDNINNIAAERMKTLADIMTWADIDQEFLTWMAKLGYDIPNLQESTQKWYDSIKNRTYEYGGKTIGGAIGEPATQKTLAAVRLDGNNVILRSSSGKEKTEGYSTRARAEYYYYEASKRIGEILSWPRGTQFVPYTGLHHLEKGEQVVPRGGKNMGGDIIINVSTNVASISSDVDINKIARTNARIIAAELGGRYGMR